jgi:hypothetical protein
VNNGKHGKFGNVLKILLKILLSTPVLSVFPENHFSCPMMNYQDGSMTLSSTSG